MNYLTFPFEKKGLISLINGLNHEDNHSLSVEVAESTFEIFQAYNNRKIDETEYPLVLKLNDPWKQNLVLFENQFPVEVFTFNTDYILNNIFTVREKSTRGFFIKSFSGFRLVLLAKPAENLLERYQMIRNKTSIVLHEINST